MALALVYTHGIREVWGSPPHLDQGMIWRSHDSGSWDTSRASPMVSPFDHSSWLKRGERGPALALKTQLLGLRTQTDMLSRNNSGSYRPSEFHHSSVGAFMHKWGSIPDVVSSKVKIEWKNTWNLLIRNSINYIVEHRADMKSSTVLRVDTLRW